MSDNAPAVNDGDIDLDTFSQEFFGGTKPEESEQEVDQEVHDEDSIVDESAVDTDNAAEADTETEAEGDSQETVEEPKKKRSVQERMNELTKQRYEAERRELETQRQLQTMQEELARLRNPQKEVPAQQVTTDQAAPDPETKLENGEAKYPLGEFDPQYIRDLARHEIDKEIKAATEYRKQAEAAASAEAATKESQARFTEKLTAYEAEDPEIQGKILSLDSTFQALEPRYGQYLIGVVRDLDNAPAVLAYLADNPEMAQKIASSGPAAATVALGRLDAQVAKVVATPKKVTKAPEPPVRTRGTQGQFAVAGDTDDLDSFSRVFFNKKGK